MPADDLFGDPPAAGEAAAPADDLFGEPAAEAPAAEAEAAPAADDLFGEPAAAEEAAPAAVDDLFGEPAAEAAAPAAEESLDDLFGTPEPAKAKEASPAAIDDLFGQAVPPAEPQQLGMRHWSDNTGLYSVDGRLIEILDGKVRIVKENGRTCTVEMRRLGKIDAEYVQLIAVTYGAGLIGPQLAAR